MNDKQTAKENKKEELQQKAKGNIINITQNAQEILPDRDQLTGVTVSNQGDDLSKTDVFGEPNKESVREEMSDTAQAANIYKGSDPDNVQGAIPTREKLKPPPELDIQGTGNDTLNEATPPSIEGEQSVSGDMPDPASDDDTLENAQVMGFKLNEDEEHPKPLDTASDVDAAEEYHRRH